MTTTTDFSVIQKEVTDKFTLLNTIYFKGDDSSGHSFLNEGILGGNRGYVINLDSEINIGNTSNINQLYNLNNNGTLLPNFIIINSSLSNQQVYKYTPNDSYTGSYTSEQLSNINNLTLTNISEINCLSLLAQPPLNSSNSSVNTDITSGKIYNFMQGLYTLYNLFEANTWQTYIDSTKTNTESGISFGIPSLLTDETVNIGSSTTTSNVTTYTGTVITDKNLRTYVDYVSPTLLDTISFSTSFNPYVARRLMYIWILLCNYLIASAYLDSVKNSTVETRTYASHLVDKTYEIIVQANKNVINNDNPFVNVTNANNYNELSDDKTYQENAVKYALFTWAVNQIKNNTKEYTNNVSTYYSTFKGTNNSYSTLNAQYDTIILQTNNSGVKIYPKIDATNKSAIVNDVKTKLNTIFDTTATTKTITKDTITNEIKTVNTTYQDSIASSTAYSRQKSSSTGNVFGSINNAVGNYIDVYNTNQTDINAISELLRTGKAELSTIKDLLNGRLATQKTQRICEYFAIAILIIFALSSFSVILMKVDKRFKLFTCIGLILFALLHFLGIQMLLNSSIFILKTPSKPIIEKFAPVANSNTITNYLNYYNVEVMHQVSEYLDNTFTLITLLESYKAYGNVNLSMERELNYYNNVVNQLSNAQSKINDIYFSSYINTIDVSALLHLFQILTIIIAATTTLFVLVEDVEDNSIRNWIASIAGIFAVFSFVVYLIEVNTRVRTNPVKIYWGDVDKNKIA